MSFNQLHGYLIKDKQVKTIKKFLPDLIEGNIYDNPNGEKGSFTIKSFRKYTWTSPDSKLDPEYIRYDYQFELVFNGTYTLWSREYKESDWKYMSGSRKRTIHRQLKYAAEKLVRDNIKVIDVTIPAHHINIKKIILKTKGV